MGDQSNASDWAKTQEGIDPKHLPGVGAGAPAQHGPGNDPRAAPGSPVGQGFHKNPSIEEVPSIAAPLPGTFDGDTSSKNYTPPPFDPPKAPEPPIPSPMHGPMNPLVWESHGPGYPKPDAPQEKPEAPFTDPGQGQ